MKKHQVAGAVILAAGVLLSGCGDSGEAAQEEIPEGQILDQSFEVELDGWGQVTFASFEPEEYTFLKGDMWMYGDARFMLLEGDRVVYRFPGLFEDDAMAGQQFGQVVSVAFKDYNEDGRKDVLLILEYAGVQGASIDQPWREGRAYTQEEGEKEFHVDRLLSEQLRYYADNMEQMYQGIEDYGKGYSVCTDLGTWEVERFAKRIKKQILAGDFESLAEEISYPVTVDGLEYADREAFLAADFIREPNPAFLSAIEETPDENLFCNWRGIMLGNGEVWFGEVTDSDTSASEGLRITAINGITLK